MQTKKFVICGNASAKGISDEPKNDIRLRLSSVKGEGNVMRVDSDSPHRTLTIRLPKYSGKTEITMQIGPVFRGTALRDAVGFIKFNEFTNQLQFAEVSTKLHERVKEKVVGANTPKQGDQISFAAGSLRTRLFDSSQYHAPDQYLAFEIQI